MYGKITPIEFDEYTHAFCLSLYMVYSKRDYDLVVRKSRIKEY